MPAITRSASDSEIAIQLRKLEIRQEAISLKLRQILKLLDEAIRELELAQSLTYEYKMELLSRRPHTSNHYKI